MCICLSILSRAFFDYLKFVITLYMYLIVFFCGTLLCKDEEGRSGPFVDKIREQEKLEKAMYIKDIENALGGSR